MDALAWLVEQGLQPAAAGLPDGRTRWVALPASADRVEPRVELIGSEDGLASARLQVTVSEAASVRFLEDWTDRFAPGALDFVVGELGAATTEAEHAAQLSVGDRTVTFISGRSTRGLPLRLTVDAGTAVMPVPAAESLEPGPAQTVLPLFARPFLGPATLTNFFDHRYPVGPRDKNGYQLTWRGTRGRASGRIAGHAGYDWLLPTGTPIVAMADGMVLSAGVDPPFDCPVLGHRVTDQRFVEILHPSVDGEVFSSVYVHLSRIDVNEGDVVEQGQQIGLSGDSGCSTEPHLHLQLWRHTSTSGGKPALVDPYGWEPTATDPWSTHREGAASAWLWLPGEAPALDMKRGA